MQIATVHDDPLRQQAPFLVLPLWEGATPAASIAGLFEPNDWSGKPKQTLLLYPRGAVPAQRVLLVGLGPADSEAPDRLRQAAAIAAQRARDMNVGQLTVAVPAHGIAMAAAAQAVVEGSLLGLYRFDQFRSGESVPTIDRLTLVAHADLEAVQQGARVGEAVARGVMLARDLSNRPGNDLTPTRLGETASELGARTSIRVDLLGPEDLQAQGFGGLLGVARGSAQPPRFIVMEYGLHYREAPLICLVGKGITFDSGGISIKPAEKMDAMKMDMSGAAAVIGALQAVADLELPLRVVGLIAAAENMPSSTAYRPGDILTTLSGTTIEVLNTDAEGRIVLADALHYAQRYEPDAIVDLATLTGAIMVALGPHAIGLMSNDDELSDRLLRAGAVTGERTWRLPLWEPYREMIKSDIADIKNSGGRLGGAITAAAFLSHFVGDYPWAHLDIAGTAWTENAGRADTPKGATGVGVRLLVQMLQTWLET